MLPRLRPACRGSGGALTRLVGQRMQKVLAQACSASAPLTFIRVIEGLSGTLVIHVAQALHQLSLTLREVMPVERVHRCLDTLRATPGSMLPNLPLQGAEDSPQSACLGCGVVAPAHASVTQVCAGSRAARCGMCIACCAGGISTDEQCRLPSAVPGLTASDAFLANNSVV